MDKFFPRFFGFLRRSPDPGTDLRRLTERVARLEERLEGVVRSNRRHLQRVAVVRFNPFGDTGGDQSFTAALLNEKGSGLVISSLHNRDKTRMYAKPVKEGGEDGYSFSKEEKQTIKRALEDRGEK